MSFVLILDSSETTSQIIELYCEILGYESVISNNLKVCDALHGDELCCKQKQCADILFIDYEITKTSGLDIIESQIEKGCKIEPRRKALIASALSEQEFKKAKRLGFHVIQKPIKFEILENWLTNVEWQTVEQLKAGTAS